MVSTVRAFRSNDGQLFGTEAEAARRDAELAVTACLKEAGMETDSVLVQAILDHAGPLASALASYAATLPIDLAKVLTPEQEAFRRRLKEGENDPRQWGPVRHEVPIKITL